MTETASNRLLLALHWLASRSSYALVNYRHPLRAPGLQAARDAYERTHTATTPLECAEIFNAVQSCNKIPGSLAEAGVYLGGTARILLSASATPNAAAAKRLHLFDTFEGLPSGEDAFVAGEWAGPIEKVRSNLSDFEDRLDFHRGFFPDSATGLEDLRFSFVHLDLDLYESTRDALEWFWPRLNAGGILLSHDYPLSNGVVRAFDEFFAKRTEPIVQLSGNQCLAVKP